MSTKVDKLLSELQEVSKYNPINESFDISSISSRLNNLKNSLLVNIGLGSYVLSEEKQKLLQEVGTISIDPSFRVVTYPNIHFEKKYKIDASIIFNYVLKRINENANSGGDNFDATAVVEEGISYTLKNLIGKTPAKRINLDDFKREYQLYAFGSYRKILVTPKVIPLTMLAKKTPITISYIENALLYKQIKNLNDYSKKIESDFLRLLKNNPSLKDILNSYMSCIERSIRALVNIYKIIRLTLVELENEYFSIFRAIKRIHEIQYGNYNESFSEINNIVNNEKRVITLNEAVSINQIDIDKMINEIKHSFNIMKINKRAKVYTFLYDVLPKCMGSLTQLDKDMSLNIPLSKYVVNSIDVNKLYYNIKQLIKISLNIVDPDKFYNISKNDINFEAKINNLSYSLSYYNKIIFNSNQPFSNINDFLRKLSSNLNEIEDNVTVDTLLENILVIRDIIELLFTEYYIKILDLYENQLNNVTVDNKSLLLYHKN